MMNCKSCQNDFEGLLFHAAEASADRSQMRARLAVEEHLAGCEACRHELAALRNTMVLLDRWEVPEPSAYFDQKLAVLLREEQAKAPAGWMERLRDRLLLNTGRQFRPALVGALALLMLLGGGSFAGFNAYSHATGEVEASAAVNDLQILDKNDQAIQQMDQLDQLIQDDGDGGQGTPAQPAS
jgi:anti-sigma factor RsiW